MPEAIDTPVAPVNPDAVAEALALLPEGPKETIEPLLHYVLLRTIVDDVEVTPGGVIIPASVRMREREESPFKRCRVLSKGYGAFSADGAPVPIQVNVGDIVLIVPDKLILVRDHGKGDTSKEGVRDFICSAGNIVAKVHVEEPSRIVLPNA